VSVGSDDRILAETKYLRLVDRRGWSFVQRCNNTGIVGIVAATRDGRLLLVEQYRPPLARNVIELPAGLVGDAGNPGETPLAGARRELLEETGYEAERWTYLFDGVSSGGLSDESISLFLAEGLSRVAEGGGDASEDITVHEIPLEEVEGWLRAREADGCAVDFRVYVALYVLRSTRKTAF
jgi:ADP-ribose pyrophosphatase